MKKNAMIISEKGTAILLYSKEEKEINEEIENLRKELGKIKVTIRGGRN